MTERAGESEREWLEGLRWEDREDYFTTCPECGGDPSYTVSIGGGAAGPCQTCLGEVEGGRGDLGSSRHALSGPPQSGEQPAASVEHVGPDTTETPYPTRDPRNEDINE